MRRSWNKGNLSAPPHLEQLVGQVKTYPSFRCLGSKMSNCKMSNCKMSNCSDSERSQMSIGLPRIGLPRILLYPRAISSLKFNKSTSCWRFTSRLQAQCQAKMSTSKCYNWSSTLRHHLWYVFTQSLTAVTNELKVIRSQQWEVKSTLSWKLFSSRRWVEFSSTIILPTWCMKNRNSNSWSCLEFMFTHHIECIGAYTKLFGFHKRSSSGNDVGQAKQVHE